MNRLIIILFVLSTVLLAGFSANRRASYKIKTVVIDAGHGGHDHGCKGHGSKEKDIALKIALKLGKLIEQNHPDVKVIYTRKSDVFVELHERAEIANRAKADLFICVHINAGSKVAQGTETYVMGLHKSEDNLAVSKRENESVLLEKDYKNKYDGYDPDSPESHIIFSLFQNTYRDKSLIFASKVQYQFVERAKRFDRGVKEAGFIVLWRTAMPAVLIECGFLSNPKEEKYLISDKGHDQLAESIYEAFKEYKIDMEEGDLGANPGLANISTYDKKTAEEVIEDRDKPKSTSNVIVAKKSDETKKNEVVKNKIDTEPKKNTEPDKTKQSVNLQQGDHDTATMKVTPPTVENKPKPKADVEPQKDMAKAEPKVQVRVETKPKPEENKPELKRINPPATTVPSANTDFVVDSVVRDMKLFYTVQIAAKPTPTQYELDSYMAVPDVKVIKVEDNVKRYVVGHFPSIAAAQDVLKQMQALGFGDAFITPYYKGKRITMGEAKMVK